MVDVKRVSIRLGQFVDGDTGGLGLTDVEQHRVKSLNKEKHNFNHFVRHKVIMIFNTIVIYEYYRN